MNRRDLFKLLGLASLAALLAGKGKELRYDRNDYGPKGGQIWHQRDFPNFTVYVVTGLPRGKLAMSTDPRTQGNTLCRWGNRTTYTQRELAKYLKGHNFTYEGQLCDLLGREYSNLYHGRDENFAFNPRDDMEYWAEHKRIKGRPNTGNWKHQHEEEAEWSSP